MSPATTNTTRRGWTLAIVSLGLFMMVLDNLVVNVALPSIRLDLGASIQTLEWTVNAYILAYAVLLLTGAALGDRLGRKRMFIAGIALFTAGSAAAALSPSIDFLIGARAVQGVAAATRDAAHADSAGRGIPSRATRTRTGRLVGHQRHRRGPRSARRWRAHPDRLVALDLLGQRADRHRADPARRRPPDREPRRGQAPGSPAAWLWSRAACSASSTAWSGHSRWVGAAPRSWSDWRRGRRCWRRSSGRSSAPRSRCCRWSSSPTAVSR